MLSACPPAFAQATAGVALRQHALSLTWPAGAPATGSLGFSDTRLRLTAEHEPLDVLKVSGGVEIQHSFGTLAGGLFGDRPAAASRPYELWNLTAEATGGSTVTRARLDRLSVTMRLGDVDLAIGRQPVGVGTSHFVGILDVLTPFSPGDLDATYRPGVDAARLRVGMGDRAEAELIGTGADPWGSGGILTRLRTPVPVVDLETVAGRFRGRTLGGLGWEGELPPVALWGELALFERLPGERVRGGAAAAAFSGVAGADWTMPGEIRTGLAYLHQDFGARDAADLALVRLDAPYREGWAFLGASDYAVLTASRQLHPLVGASVAGIWNLVDGSSLWQPRLAISVSDEADLGLYAWVGAGNLPSADGPGSEFGPVPRGGGLYARWFF